MKISLEWVKDYVDLPADLDVAQIAHDLTMTTVEVEDVIELAKTLEQIIIATIVKISAHPKSEKLWLVSCDIGNNQLKEIVCGGSNLSVDMRVALALPGAKVRWHGQGDLVEIKQAPIAGVESFGMICAASEIGLSELFPAKEDKEILDMTGFSAFQGQALADALGWRDVIFEIDNKSLTNRPDLWGHYGIARELAAIYKLPLKPMPVLNYPQTDKKTAINIENPEFCPRYTATVITGVKTAVSPFWLQSRLSRVEQRSINLLVDLTNYVMFATGQPCHVFDSQKIQGGIHIGFGKEQETMLLLNGKPMDVSPQSLMIADDGAPVALAGVMGGKDSSVDETTASVILEVANFDSLVVRRGAGRHGLRTESSKRFEKGLHPALVDEALGCFWSVLSQIEPDAKIESFADNYPKKSQVVSIDVPLAFLFHRLGKVLPETEITACLQKLGFSVVVKDGSLQLGVPFWRSTGDISLPEDIVEEVARLHGYDKFELLPLTVELHKAISQPLFALERNIKEYLAYSCGMQEVFSYPWVDDRYFAAAGINEQQALRLFAPPAPDQCRLSTSLVLQMQQVITINQRHFDNFRVFELNRTFAAKAVDLPAESGENLPAQAKMLVGVCAGQEAITVFLEAKGILENMSRAIQLQKPLSFHKPTDSITWADANAQLGIFVDEQQIGVLGLLSQKAMRLSGIKRVYAAVFELEVAFLNPNLSRQNKFSHLPEYPEVDFDLNLVFADTVKWSDIKQLSLESDKLVTNVGFVDEYRGKQIPDGKKSITFRITLGSPTATLVAAEIEAVTEKLIKNLVTRFEAELR